MLTDKNIITAKLDKIDIIRFSRNSILTYSDLYINDELICKCFENSKCLVQVGTYSARYYLSPKMQSKVILLNVPNRKYIEIHSANYYWQLKGCIAPFTTLSPIGGYGSSKQLKNIFDKLKSGFLIQVNIKDYINYNKEFSPFSLLYS